MIILHFHLQPQFIYELFHIKTSHYVKGTVNKEKSDLLFGTGAEVSLVSFSTPGLMITDS